MQPSTSSVLTTLSRQRIAEIARTAGLPLPDLTKEQQVDQLVHALLRGVVVLSHHHHHNNNNKKTRTQ